MSEELFSAWNQLKWFITVNHGWAPGFLDWSLKTKYDLKAVVPRVLTAESANFFVKSLPTHAQNVKNEPVRENFYFVTKSNLLQYLASNKFSVLFLCCDAKLFLGEYSTTHQNIIGRSLKADRDPA